MHTRGILFNEGKTKKVHELKSNSNLVRITSKDDITAGDGAKHDIIPQKGQFANETTCNVFRLLKKWKIPVAFIEQIDEISFIALKCDMLPYEVVVRREAHGSYLKRNPHLEKGHYFSELIVEFFLKTKGKCWKAHQLICDDPLMFHSVQDKEIHLFDPGAPLDVQEPFLTLPETEVFRFSKEWELFSLMSRIAAHAFLIVENAWKDIGGNLVDYKVEFGITLDGRLLLADVIDNDSWRVVENGEYIDKQVYRDGGALNEVIAKYKRVAEMTKRFL